MRIAGIDGGLTGSLSVLDGKSLVDVIDLPVINVPPARKGGRKRSRYDLEGALALLRKIQPLELVIIERLQSMSGRADHGERDPAELRKAVNRAASGSIANFQKGYGMATYEMACVATDTAYEVVAPISWKTHFDLTRRRSGLESYEELKEAARLLAIQIWPEQRDFFARKGDHNRAEAALLAEYGRQKHGIGDLFDG